MIILMIFRRNNVEDMSVTAAYEIKMRGNKSQTNASYYIRLRR